MLTAYTGVKRFLIIVTVGRHKKANYTGEYAEIDWPALTGADTAAISQALKTE